MKKNSILILFSFIIISCGSNEKSKDESIDENKATVSNSDSTVIKTNLEKSINDTNFVTGDIIFQTSYGHQSDLVSVVTQSPFTHCGIIRNQDGNLFVVEASSTVKSTPLSEWIKGGKEEKYVVMRLKKFELYKNIKNSEKAQKAFQSFDKKEYDSQFSWSDEKLYCSEFVWKLFKEGADLPLCPLRRLKEYDLSTPEVKAELTKRYGNNIPYEEMMVSPADIAASDELTMIFSNY